MKARDVGTIDSVISPLQMRKTIRMLMTLGRAKKPIKPRVALRNLALDVYGV